MEYYDGSDDYLPEFNNEYNQVTMPSKIPTNSLDYMKFNSEEYLKYKFELKVKDQIKELYLDERIIKEIVDRSFISYKQIKQKEDVNLKIADLISIVAFKVIKNYNLPLSHCEVFSKLNLRKGKYLKYSKIICNENEKSDIFLYKVNEPEKELIQKEKFNTSLLQYVNFIINKLTELYKYQPDALKLQSNKIEIMSFLDNFNKNEKETQLTTQNNKLNFIDVPKILETTKTDIKNLINISNSDLDFFSYFHNNYHVESLTAALVKNCLERNGIKVKLSIFKEHFNIPRSTISKVGKKVEEFLKIVKYK